MKRQLQGALFLLGATIIWGAAFVAQSVGMEHIGPFTFQTCRSFLAVIALWIVIGLFYQKKGDAQAARKKWEDPKLWKTGLLCGLALFVASGLQQVALLYTNAGKAGFITAMYIILVPVLGLFFHRPVSGQVWVSVVLAVCGLYLLSAMGSEQLNMGDVLLMLCALAFAVQIILIDRLAGDLDGLRLNLVQFLVVAVLSGILMVLREPVRWQTIADCALPLLYTGVLSSAVGYSLQILGQQRLEPAPACLIMSLESVFAALSGWLLLDEHMRPVELVGCTLVFLAVVLAQWKPGKGRRKDFLG